MNLYKQWEKLAEKQDGQEEYESFWKMYFEKEKENYIKILNEKNNKLEGTVKELAAEFDMDTVMFTGFLDGINSSIVTELNLDELTEDTSIVLDIVWEKLYFNMLDAKAEWLFTLEQWDDILTVDKRSEITKEYRISQVAVSTKVGRNDPCPCGSGKKFKKCCGSN